MAAQQRTKEQIEMEAAAARAQDPDPVPALGIQIPESARRTPMEFPKMIYPVKGKGIDASRGVVVVDDAAEKAQREAWAEEATEAAEAAKANAAPAPLNPAEIARIKAEARAEFEAEAAAAAKAKAKS